MANALLGLVAHPFAVVAHVFSETLRAFPTYLRTNLLPRLGINRWLAGEFRGDLYHRLADQHRNRVQITRIGIESKPLCFQRDRSAPRERIVKRRTFVSIE